MRYCTALLLLLAATAVCMATGCGAAAPLHDFKWCKANMVCLNPDFPVMGMYFLTDYGYSCTCSVSEGTCNGASGQAYCQYASANVNCASQFYGETEATNARYEYGMCTACNTGYQLSNDPYPSYGCWACSATVPYCTHCSSDGVCDTCLPLYTLASGGKKCYACGTTGCTSCTADHICGTCASGYTLSPDKKLCFSCGIANCNGCTANGVCGSCQAGYTLSTDSKTCYTCGITGCNGCTANNVCGSCTSGYTLSPDNSACYSCSITGCSGCTANNVCGSCQAGYTLSANRSTCYTCGITGCTGCTTDNVCASCTSSYTLSTDGQSCIPCSVDGCLSCSSSGVCAVCASGYKLSGTSGTCKKSGLAWWVWLIVGLVAAAAIVAVIIIVCCCCCKPRVSPLHAEEERIAVDVNPLSDSAPLVEFDDAKDTSIIQLQRVPSSRVRRVSLGGEIVLDATHPGLPQFPSSRSILPVPAAAEHQPLIPQQPQREDNSSDWQADSVSNYSERDWRW